MSSPIRCGLPRRTLLHRLLGGLMASSAPVAAFRRSIPLASGYHWQCTACTPGGSTGYRFFHIAGTIFENTNKPLRDWFKVTHLMLTAISSRQIGRYMGFGSVKTAWQIGHRIRTAVIERDMDNLPLYVAKFQLRYNYRFNDDIFGTASVTLRR